MAFIVPRTTDNDAVHRLQALSRDYADSLRPETRRRILREGLASARAGRVASPLAGPTFRLLAAAAVLVVLVAPALLLTGPEPPALATGVKDLTVTAVNGQVVLTWTNGGQPHRVVRATSRAQLAHLDQLPGETVTGQRWVDDQPSDSSVVYYSVE